MKISKNEYDELMSMLAFFSYKIDPCYKGKPVPKSTGRISKSTLTRTITRMRRTIYQGGNGNKQKTAEESPAVFFIQNLHRRTRQ